MTTNFVPVYDLASLSEDQKQNYIVSVCKHMGVPPELNLIVLSYLDEGDGPRRLVVWAKRGATEIVRNNRGINVVGLESKEIGGSVVFTATGKDNTGRQEMATGSMYIKDLLGESLDDAIMTAQTRACRRMTLQFIGAGVLDESEVRGRVTVTTAQGPQPVAPIPATKPNDSAGELLAVDTPRGVTLAEQKAISTFEIQQAKLRQDAIDQLNAKQSQNPQDVAEAKPRRKYTRKAKVDLGPSEPIITTVVPTPPVPPVVVIPEPPVALEPLKSVDTPVVPLTPAKPRLSPEQVKPFRQRLFRLQNDYLEPNGFVPKEGMGNADKMRAFAQMMFEGLTNMNDLTVDQWEKYLTCLEQYNQKNGAAATVKYIEESIGL